MSRESAVTTVYLVRWAQTDWQGTGRLVADTSLPINEAGHAELDHIRRQLEGQPIRRVYTGTQDIARQTGEALAAMLGARCTALEDLNEMALGLWEGLTPRSLRERFPRVYRRWVEDPTSVRPPEGESMEEARSRLAEAIRTLASRHIGEAIVIVVGHLSWALLRTLLDGAPLDRMWERLNSPEVCVRYDIPPERVMALAG